MSQRSLLVAVIGCAVILGLIGRSAYEDVTARNELNRAKFDHQEEVLVGELRRMRSELAARPPTTRAEAEALLGASPCSKGTPRGGGPERYSIAWGLRSDVPIGDGRARAQGDEGLADAVQFGLESCDPNAKIVWKQVPEEAALIERLGRRP